MVHGREPPPHRANHGSAIRKEPAPADIYAITHALEFPDDVALRHGRL